MTREDAPPTTLRLCACYSSFKFPGETLTSPACVRCLLTPGNPLWSEDSAHKSNTASGGTQCVSDTRFHLWPFAQAIAIPVEKNWDFYSQE